MLIDSTDEGLGAALGQISADAWRRDGDPSFPHDSVDALRRAGALGLTAHGAPHATQWAVVRAVSAADPVVGRIFERHLEAVEHVLHHAPEPLRSDELDAIASGQRVLGVWDEDGDEPARLRDGTVHGVKLHAVGAGGIDRAVVPVDGPEPAAVYVDVREDVEVDRAWRVVGGEARSAGDRVELHGARVVTVLRAWSGHAPRALGSRAELRRVAAWMGTLDALAEAAMWSLAQRGTAGDEEALAAGRMAAARRTLDLWLDDAARRADADPLADLSALAAQTRAAVAVIAGSVLQEATVATRDGERPAAFARARRELARMPGIERPETALASAGRELLRRRRGA